MMRLAAGHFSGRTGWFKILLRAMLELASFPIHGKSNFD
jgi:hypothetical protein